MARLALALLLSWPSATVLAAELDPEGEAIEHLDRGHELYTAGDFTGALAEFVRARDLVPTRGTAYRWVGMAEAALGRWAEAAASLEVFLKRATAGDARVTEASALRDRCLREIAPKVGILVVESRPAGAEVRLDDEAQPPLGVTPHRQEDVPIGAHRIFLRRAGHEPLRKDVVVALGETVRLELELRAHRPATAAPRPPGPPLYRRWSLWIGLGAALVAVGAAAVTAALLWPPSEHEFPPRVVM